MKASGGYFSGEAAANTDPFGPDFKSELLYLKKAAILPGKNGQSPGIPVPSVRDEYEKEYIEYGDSWCKKTDGNPPSDDLCEIGFTKGNKRFGMGGCASVDKIKYWPGTDGAVRITCEKWRN